ncbi:MAG: YraN family protein [Verrucomicrobiota bacterium]
MLNSPWLSEGAAVPDKDTVGRLGERMAARWLHTRGCRVLYRNYRAPKGGELDVVCRHGEVLAFVEVKTRTSTAFGRPAAAVTPDKQQLIVRGAQGWLRLLHDREFPWRFDVVEVLLIPGRRPELNWIQSAFNTDELRQTLAGRKR